MANTLNVIEWVMQCKPMVHLPAHLREAGQLFGDTGCPSLADRCIRHDLGLMGR